MVGRPPSKKPLAERVILRVLPEERAAWLEAAQRAGLSLSAWIREVLNRAAARASKAGKR